MAAAVRKSVGLVEAQNEFNDTIGERWDAFKQQLGVYLLKYEAILSQPMFHQLKKWISHKHRISIVQQTVSMRLAKGELDERLLKVIPASTLAATPIHCIPDPDRQYQIYSPDVGAPVKKRVTEMSKAEIASCVTIRGISTIDKPLKLTEPSPRQCAFAKFVRVEKDHIVSMMGDLEIRIKLTDQLRKAVAGS